MKVWISVIFIETFLEQSIINRQMSELMISSPHNNIGFPAHFRHLFSISSRTLWNVRMLVSISSLVDQFWNIVIQFRALSPIFVNCNSNSSVTVAEHETVKTISSIGIHFRQSFNQFRLPGVEAQ